MTLFVPQDRLSVTSACTAASDFIKLYYDFVDKVRLSYEVLVM